MCSLSRLCRNNQVNDDRNLDREITQNETDSIAREDRRFVACVANNCHIIPASRLVVYDNENDCRWTFAQLISGIPMSTDPDKKANRFSIEIVNTGNTRRIHIGLVPKDYGSDAAPGWFSGSVGFHGDDGGLYIEDGYPKRTTHPMKAGETMSIEVRSEEKKTVGCFKRNNDVCYEFKLDPVGKVFYPCLAMRSRGAAVKLVENAFWMLDKAMPMGETEDDSLQDIPTLPTWKMEDGIFISSEKCVSLPYTKGQFGGWISMYNPKMDIIAFEVNYGSSQTEVSRGFLFYREVWAKYYKILNDDLREKITMKWIRVQDEEMTKYHNGELSLEEIISDNETSIPLTFEIDDRQIDSEQTIGDSSFTENLPESLFWDGDEDEDSDGYMSDRSTSTSVGSDDSFAAYTDRHTRSKDKVYTDLLKALHSLLECEDDAKKRQLLRNVEKILKNNEDINLNFSERLTRSTPLHIAARLNSPKLVEMMFERNAFPNFKNEEGDIPLEIAIHSLESKQKDKTATTIVKRMPAKSVVNLFWARGNPSRIRLTLAELLDEGLIETTEAVLDLFKTSWGMEYLVAPLELDENCRCPGDEGYGDDGYNKDHPTAYQIIAQQSLEELANHDCLKSLTQYKWNKYGQFLFLLSFFLYLVFWVALTTAVVTGVMAEDATAYNKPIDYVRLSCEFAALCYAFLTLVGEGMQLYVQGCKYFSDAYNYLDISSSLLIICVLPLRLSYIDAQWGVFAVGYIAWTFRSIKFLTVFRGLGLLGHMIIQLIIQDVWKFILFYLVILFGFSGGLLLSFKGDGDLDVHNETSTFWGILFVGVQVLIEGQPFLEYTGPSGYRTFSCVIMLLFLASTCVVMLNIFIAQLSNRFTVSTKLIEKRLESHRAATIAKFERGDDLTSFTLFCSCCTPLWVQHFKETVYTYEIQRDGSSEVTLHDLYRLGGMKGVLRHLCRFLKYIIPCWIHRKCHRAEWDDDSEVSDCEPTCEQCCENQCYCKPLCCRGTHFSSSDSSSFDVTSTDESSIRF